MNFFCFMHINIKKLCTEEKNIVVIAILCILFLSIDQSFNKKSSFSFHKNFDNILILLADFADSLVRRILCDLLLGLWHQKFYDLGCYLSEGKISNYPYLVVNLRDDIDW